MIPTLLNINAVKFRQLSFNRSPNGGFCRLRIERLRSMLYDACCPVEGHRCYRRNQVRTTGFAAERQRVAGSYFLLRRPISACCPLFSSIRSRKPPLLDTLCGCTRCTARSLSCTCLYGRNNSLKLFYQNEDNFIMPVAVASTVFVHFSSGFIFFSLFYHVLHFSDFSSFYRITAKYLNTFPQR